MLLRELIESRRAMENRGSSAERHRKLCVNHGLGTIFLSAWFADNVPSRFQNRNFDVGDIGLHEAVITDDFQDSVDRSLHIPAAGVGLNGGAQDFVGISQARRQAFGDRVTRICMQKTITALENSPWTSKALGRQHGCLNAILRSQSRMDSLGPSAFRQKFHAPGGHAPGDPDRCQCLLFREAE